MFEAFLQELAKVLDFSMLAPDNNGACLIVMKEGNVPLLFELDEQLVPNKILVSTLVADFPLDRRTEIYEECLRINHLFEATASVKPDEDALYLHRRIAPGIQASELETVIQSFLAQVHQMKTRIHELLSKSPKHPKVPPSPSSIQVFPYKA